MSSYRATRSIIEPRSEEEAALGYWTSEELTSLKAVRETLARHLREEAGSALTVSRGTDRAARFARDLLGLADRVLADEWDSLRTVGEDRIAYVERNGVRWGFHGSGTR